MPKKKTKDLGTGAMNLAASLRSMGIRPSAEVKEADVLLGTSTDGKIVIIPKAIEPQLQRFMDARARAVGAGIGGMHLLLWGPRGSGKSTLSQHLLSTLFPEDMRWRLQGHKGLRNEEWFGSFVPTETAGKLVARESDYIIAYSGGGGVLVEEFSQTSPMHTSNCFSLMDRLNSLNVSFQGYSRKVTRDPAFTMILTDNTNLNGDDGMHSGTEGVNIALKSRIAASIYVPYLEREQEVNLLSTMVSKLSKHQLGQMIDVAEATRGDSEYSEPLDTRTLMNWAFLADVDGSANGIQQAYEMAVVAKADIEEWDTWRALYRHAIG